MNENLIVTLEEKGIVSETFRKLNPQKKTRLYQAGLNEFAREVFDRVSIDRIADAAGVSKGSLFQYFGNKDNLLHFCCEIFIDNYRQFWESQGQYGEGVHTRERMRSFFMTLLDFRGERRVEYDFYIRMLYENSRALSGEFIRRINTILLERLHGIIHRGARTAEIRQDIQPERIAMVIMALVEASHRYADTIDRKYKNRERLMEIINDAERILFDGIGG